MLGKICRMNWSWLGKTDKRRVLGRGDLKCNGFEEGMCLVFQKLQDGQHG